MKLFVWQMQEMRYVLLRGTFCAAFASALALAAHVYVQAWALTQIEYITGVPEPALPAYSFSINVAAYATAFITVGVVTLVYYWAGDRLPIRRRPLKALLLTALLLEFKGALLRMPIMNALVYAQASRPYPITLAFLGEIDVWIANILLAFCVVYLCPVRNSVEPIPPLPAAR